MEGRRHAEEGELRPPRHEAQDDDGRDEEEERPEEVEELLRPGRDDVFLEHELDRVGDPLEEALRPDPVRPLADLEPPEEPALRVWAEQGSLLREFVEARPEELPLREQLAALLLLNNQPNEADTVLHEVEKEKPGRANLYPVLANLYDELNLPGRSEIYRVLALYSNRPPALNDILRLALQQLRGNQPRRAFSTVEYGSGFYPDSLQLLLVQGMAQKAQNRMSEAAATFAKVERLVTRVMPDRFP